MSASASDASVRERQIADTLLAMRGAGMDWGQIYQSGDQPWSKKIANGFLLCSLLDYQIPSPKAWANGDRLVNDILGDPDDVWFAIASVSEASGNRGTANTSSTNSPWRICGFGGLESASATRIRATPGAYGKARSHPRRLKRSGMLVPATRSHG